MIKLFWNTHNQIKINGKEDREFIWGKYHRENSDKWIYEVLKKVRFKEVKSEKEVEKKLGKLAIFEGVKKYPARVKCATLSWHALMAALEGEKKTTTE